jgi:hypothetical protein
VRLEGLGQLNKFNDLIGNRTRDLPACNIIPQPTTLPRAPLCVCVCVCVRTYTFKGTSGNFIFLCAHYLLLKMAEVKQDQILFISFPAKYALNCRFKCMLIPKLRNYCVSAKTI